MYSRMYVRVRVCTPLRCRNAPYVRTLLIFGKKLIFQKISGKKCAGAVARAGAKNGVRVRVQHITIFV